MDESRIRALVARFLVQVEETAPRIARSIVELESRSSDPDALRQGFDSMARDIHGLKGTAAMLALSHVASLAHAAEEVLRKHRAAGRPFGREVADRMLEASDAFVALVRARTRDEAGPPTDELMAALGEFAAATLEAPEAPARRPVAPAPGAETPASTDGAWRVDAKQVEVLVRGVESVREVFQRLDEHARDLGRLIEALGPGVDPQLRTRARELGRAVTFTSREASHVAETLEEDIKTLATMPVHSILEPMHRAVRDLCRSQGKEATLSVVGGEHSLDRVLLDSMGKMLTHLVRNAVDHGLETPEERERAGKDRSGALVIRVEPQGNVVVLELSDDGRGVDVSRVRARAAEAGLATESELAALPPDQVARLVFHDGLSTRDVATETSGRGVGLAAVRRDAERLGGHVDLYTRAGQGTRFVVVLPVALGTTPVLVVRAGEQLFGIPLLAVETARRCHTSDLRVTWDAMELLHNDELLPLYDLAVLLGLREIQPPSDGQPLFVVVSTEGRAAVVVDEVIGDRELVLRSLPLELRAISAYQGVGMLALRETVLVCRPAWLVGAHRATSSVAPPRARRALVVDDSLAVRAMHRTLLEAAGYVVHTASSGAQALERATRARYDAVIADLAMEGMDGVTLTRALRARPDGHDLTIVVVTASDRADRDAALAAGADDVIDKGACASGRLIEALEAARPRRAS